MPAGRNPDPSDVGRNRLQPVSLPLFVYGTLRSGGGEERRLFGATRLGETTMEGVLYDFGEYPALVATPGLLVHGELWRCSRETLSQLDTYEGVTEGLFERVRLDSAAGPCWAYVAGRRLVARLDRAMILPAGRWKAPG